MPESDKAPKRRLQNFLDAFFTSLNSSPDGWSLKTDKVFQVLFLGVLFLGSIVLVVSNLLMLQEKKWALIAIDVLFFIWLAVLYVQRKSLSREMVIMHFMVLTYLIGGAVMFMAGPLRAGILYLFTFQILTAGFYGIRAARVSMALNVLLLVCIGVATSQGYLSWNVLPEKRLFLWISISTNFIFLTAVASMVIVTRNREILGALEGERQAAADLRQKTLEREAAVQALEESEYQYRQLVENINEVVFSLDERGCFSYVSPKITLITGYDPARLMYKPFTILVPPDQKDQVGQWLDQAKTGSGSSLSCEVQTNGDEFKWVSVTLSPFQTEAKNAEIFGLLKDITEHKSAKLERERLETRLAQAQKMEAIGRLAGGIAHDFNNMLSPVLGYAEMLLHDFPEDTKAQENLTEIISAASRAKDLVRQILIFGSKAEDHPRPLELGVLVRDALRLVKASLPSSTTMMTLIAPHRFVVNADPTQIQRVLMNICSNASHAMQGKEGLLEVILEKDFLTNGRDSAGRPIKPGPYARLTIKDNGHGMPPEVLDKIFEPYFTTKGVGEGTGIGLAVAHSIITNLGGSIQVTSMLGKWTCFCILLPLLDGDPVEEKPEETSPMPLGTGHILLVDDEPSLIHMTRQMLSRLGYEVTTASDGLEALNALDSSGKHFDLLITDLSMPGLTGDKLAMHVKEHYPGLPIILCTGFTESLSKSKADKIGISAILSKPVDIRRMALTVYRLINPK